MPFNNNWFVHSFSKKGHFYAKQSDLYIENIKFSGLICVNYNMMLFERKKFVVRSNQI